MKTPQHIQHEIIQRALVEFELAPWADRGTVMIRRDTQETVEGPWTMDEIELARQTLRNYQTTLIMWALDQYERQMP